MARRLGRNGREFDLMLVHYVEQPAIADQAAEKPSNEKAGKAHDDTEKDRLEGNAGFDRSLLLYVIRLSEIIEQLLAAYEPESREIEDHDEDPECP